MKSIFAITLIMAATSPLIGYIDFASDKGNVSGDLTLVWGASGIFNVN